MPARRSPSRSASCFSFSVPCTSATCTCSAASGAAGCWRAPPPPHRRRGPLPPPGGGRGPPPRARSGRAPRAWGAVGPVTTPANAPDVGPVEPAPRGEQTRQLVVDTAVRLFREHGYDRTTMRGIAQAAGLSVGNAYYYFPSKEHLVQEFYARIMDEHRAALQPLLSTRTQFAERLHAAYRTGVDVMSPYHAFAGRFFRIAADPASPMSPFSTESAPARERSVALFRDLVTGSETTIDPQLREDLPELLWLLHMGLTLFWVHDRSPGQEKTRLLIDRAVPLVDRLVRLARLRGVRPVAREVLAPDRGP